MPPSLRGIRLLWSYAGAVGRLYLRAFAEYQPVQRDVEDDVEGCEFDHVRQRVAILHPAVLGAAHVNVLELKARPQLLLSQRQPASPQTQPRAYRAGQRSLVGEVFDWVVAYPLRHGWWRIRCHAGQTLRPIGGMF